MHLRSTKEDVLGHARAYHFGILFWGAHAHLILACACAFHFGMRMRISLWFAQVHLTFLLRMRFSFWAAHAHLILVCASALDFICAHASHFWTHVSLLISSSAKLYHVFLRKPYHFFSDLSSKLCTPSHQIGLRTIPQRVVHACMVI